jgi:fructose/tagatose bisphosphate aldolase
VSVSTTRARLCKTLEKLAEKEVSMAVFATSSHWNTEAILLAASAFARKWEIKNIPVGVCVTFSYPHMPQSVRATYAGNPKFGFLSLMAHLRVLCDSDESAYYDVLAFPHLDHADPVADKWALTEGIPHLASVMFDAQKYPYEENVEMTSRYVRQYGRKVVVEGIIDELAVEGAAAGSKDDGYAERACSYVKATGVDLMVANLGTEQQSTAVGNCTYLGDRARDITGRMKKPVLVLHGTSCLPDSMLADLARDGVIRLNVWSRIARQAGQYAARKIVERIEKIEAGDFESAESRQYIFDSIEKASHDMEAMLLAMGYEKLAGSSF